MIAETKRATVPRHPPPGKSPLQTQPSGPSAGLVKCGPAMPKASKLLAGG